MFPTFKIHVTLQNKISTVWFGIWLHGPVRLSHVKIHLRTNLVPSDLRTIWTALGVIRGRVTIIFINLKVQDTLELTLGPRKFVIS